MKIVSLAPETLWEERCLDEDQEGRQVEVLTGRTRVSAARYFAYIQKQVGRWQGRCNCKRHVEANAANQRRSGIVEAEAAIDTNVLIALDRQANPCWLPDQRGHLDSRLQVRPSGSKLYVFLIQLETSQSTSNPVIIR